MASDNSFEREYHQQKEISATLRGENAKMQDEIHRVTKRETDYVLIIGFLSLVLVLISITAFRTHIQVGKLQDALDSSYDAGYSSGHSDGYSRGYSDCEDQLRPEYDSQFESQYDKGYKDGYLSALSKFGLFDY